MTSKNEDVPWIKNAMLVPRAWYTYAMYNKSNFHASDFSDGIKSEIAIDTNTSRKIYFIRNISVLIVE